MSYVGPEGPLDAALIILAEKPGRDEVAAGRPLVGATGQAVMRHLASIGFRREDVYLTNACKRVSHFDNPTDDEIKAELPALYRELASLTRPRVLVALGDVALRAASNFHLQGITKWRGSVIQTALPGLKMVPSFHPSYYMRGEWRFKPIVDFDFKRAEAELHIDNVRYRPRTFHLEPTFSEAMQWFDALQGSPYISFDIETFKPAFIGCIAFAPAIDLAYCIPIMHNDRRPYWTPQQEVQIWRRIQALLADHRTTYITQNGMFDCYHLWRHGVQTPYMHKGFDTLYAHRVLAPDLPHDLAFLVSLYTSPVEPYYKDESGSWARDVRVPEHQFWIYNCKDAACTLEVAFAMMEDMRQLETV